MIMIATQHVCIFFLLYFLLFTIFAHDKMNYSDVQLLKLVGPVCRYFMHLSAKHRIVLSVLFAIDRGREKIKNLLAHGQSSESSKIIHQAYNGDFRVSSMIISVIGMRACAGRQSCG